MTGYQEILTDPSYAGRSSRSPIRTSATPASTREDVESRRVFAAGLVIRDLPRLASSWRSQDDLSSYLAPSGIVRHRRHRHAQADAHAARARARRTAASWPARRSTTAAAERAVDARARGAVDGGHGPREGRVLQRSLRVDRERPGRSARATRAMDAARFHVVAYDYGVKHNILRMLAAARLPAHRGAGADAGARRAGAAARRRVPLQRPRRSRALRLRDRARSARSSTAGLPMFGICLGHQLLGLAARRRAR